MHLASPDANKSGYKIYIIKVFETTENAIL